MDKKELKKLKQEFKNMNNEQRIKTMYKIMGTSMTTPSIFSNGKLFDALSQYGYVLETGFQNKEDAEQYIINHYSSRMNLINQYMILE